MSTLAGPHEPDPDPPESLAARLKQRFGEGVDPGVSLHAAEESGEKGGKEADFSSALVARLSGRSGSFGRYVVKGEIARGGMGAILKIWDEDLHRHLAMKVILGQVDARPSQGGVRPRQVDEQPGRGDARPDQAGARAKQAGQRGRGEADPARACDEGAKAGGARETPPIETSKLARFLEEAQVTGQLDHPGIVPVHELGLDPEGRVYFTMKLVKGRSLKEVFDLVAEGKEGWSQTKALGVLLKVCEAMAYAHDKGVIHRDLKPANVMVGKFGEVHVMDWGLARILGREDERDLRIREEIPASSTEMRSERDEHRGETPESPLYTMDGDVVGTPAYMPPEQAAGRVNEMGPHSDVYALGAMLYHLLAGHMPYVPKGARLNNYAVWGLVQQGPPTPIAQIARETPAELVAICEKSMARNWNERYRDMSEFAADLSAYLEHRVVGAYQTGAWAEAKKWVERNKPLAASLAAAVGILVSGIVASATFAVDAKQQAKRAEDKTAEAKSEALRADQKTDEANRLKDEALAQGRELRVRGLIQELMAFESLDDSLDYARRQTRPAHEWWLERAYLLIDGCKEDLSKSQHWKPGLADVEAQLAKVRAQALTWTEEEQVADRTSHPRAKELAEKRAKLQWLSQMLGLEPWLSEAEVEAQLAKEAAPAGPTDASEPNASAWRLVDPDAPVFGQEEKAVLFARRAVALAAEGERHLFRDTLAWALLRTGRFDEALAEERSALAEIVGDRKAELEVNLARMELEVGSWRSEAASKLRSAERAALTAEVDALEREVRERRTWRFADSENEWWNDQLTRLAEDLHRLKDRIVVAERSVKSPEASRLWREAIAAIATSPKYGGLGLTPQIGLLPIGADPESGLWEFAHLPTGKPAVRGLDGKLVLKPEMGLVFVLLPGGRVPVEDGGKPTPVNEVDLDAFFLSKYEMTIEQWTRVANWTGRFFYDSEAMIPANAINWIDCMATLAGADSWIWLPTEGQWEYGSRAGARWPWWTGTAKDSLHGAEHIGFSMSDREKGKPRPVGQLRANPFGLHDVHGNISEWCREDYGRDVTGEEYARRGDGEREASGDRWRVIRGGTFNHPASRARFDSRTAGLPEDRFINLGLRPARGITP